ncbi:MAG: nucleoside recognition domain-containing protein [Crocinitomicaceae bacterium]
MVLNYIWITFFLVALIVAILKTFNGDMEVFSAIVSATFDMASASFTIAIGLTGVLCLWLGIMKIGENGGAIKVLAKLVGPFFNKLFPDLSADHPARGSMLMNFSANMLGLDNAATPMGLKAMNEMQEANPIKDRASNAQIMFLVLNTSGLTLIPVVVMNYRNIYGAENPADIFLPIMIATFFASLVGLITVAIYQKINLFDKVIIAYLGGLTALIAGMIWYFNNLEPEVLAVQSKLFSSIILYGLICTFIIMALVKKVNVYESFIEGAKDGFGIAIKIIPYLVAILVSIAVFRASGAFDYVIDGLRFIVSLFTDKTEFVDALPTALMKPLSGSGARGMMIDSFETYGVDSFVGKLSATLQGATDTTFYIIALYFGSVGIKKTRYAITAGLIADFAGIIAAIIIAYMFFGDSINVTNYSQAEISKQYSSAVNNKDYSTIGRIIDKEVIIYDQALDTIATDSSSAMLNFFKNDPVTISLQNNIKEDGKTITYIKGETAAGVKKSYQLEIAKQKIQSIKYLGNF